ncbi:hypothetical protein [Gallaecimonas xiamenensis]|uniref:Uncharacterized protein n=1 Tax=Gallaecimonas xiamenensis 3-C-1 TaxID=745411 RepID=K2K1N1_9GAMM|nr:hypothetical protein [Gallaecimonas xiamenensis]EKE76699.1 hypothetical protein B3C1_03860 [Gallaecimonas xiamenensis 3-C-1]
MKNALICSLAIAGLALAPMAAQADRWGRHGHGHGHGSKVIVVKPGYHHYGPAPRHRYYHRDALAGIATFAILAGVTYAIVDNAYYRQNGSGYTYVDRPPAGSYQVVDNGYSGYNGYSGGDLSPGTVVDAIVGPTKKIAYEGRLYYVANGIWYLPVDGGSQYVVVRPRY